MKTAAGARMATALAPPKSVANMVEPFAMVPRSRTSAARRALIAAPTAALFLLAGARAALSKSTKGAPEFNIGPGK